MENTKEIKKENVIVEAPYKRLMELTEEEVKKLPIYPITYLKNKYGRVIAKLLLDPIVELERKNINISKFNNLVLRLKKPYDVTKIKFNVYCRFVQGKTKDKESGEVKDYFMVQAIIKRLDDKVLSESFFLDSYSLDNLNILISQKKIKNIDWVVNNTIIDASDNEEESMLFFD